MSSKRRSKHQRPKLPDFSPGELEILRPKDFPPPAMARKQAKRLRHNKR